MQSEAPGILIQREIASQARAWSELLPTLVTQIKVVCALFEGIEEVMITGCGSGLNAALFAAPLLQAQTGISARAVPAAECSLFPDCVLVPSRKTLAILFSRSGQTTEVVEALADLQKRDVRTIGITCTPDSPLAQRSEASILLDAVAEQAIVTTRSLTGMLLAAQVLAALVSGDQAYLSQLELLPLRCAAQLEDYRRLGREIGGRSDLEAFAFVGSGPFFGLAREGQLKVKETSLRPADAYPVLDYRHGPQSTVNLHTLLVALLSDRGRAAEERFLQDMKSLGGTILALCDQASPALRACTDYVLETGPGLGERARGPLYMPIIQTIAATRALALGLDPDRPQNLSYWIDASGQTAPQ
jgi:glucosamine--fructose-6-phosphate aminotransferase (isomerizing)